MDAPTLVTCDTFVVGKIALMMGTEAEAGALRAPALRCEVQRAPKERPTLVRFTNGG